MLIKETTAKAFPSLIKLEYKTHFFFNCAANWCAKNGYQDAYEYFKKESLDEINHTQMLQEYLLDNQADVVFPELDYSEPTFSSLIDIIQQSLDLMVLVKDGYEIVSVKIFDEDNVSFNFLQKFIKIQRGAIAYWSNLVDTTKDLEPTKFNQLYLQKFLK